MKALIFPSAAILALIAALALTGCSSKPIDELKMARTAMQQAQEVEAEEYAPQEWDRAQMQWEEANGLVQMGRYGEAREVLTLAVGNFNTARDKANRRVESLKIEITALKNNIDTGRKDLEQAAESPKTKPAVKKRIEGALPLIAEKTTVMNTAYDEKLYLRARTAGEEASRWIRELQNDLTVSP